MPYMPELGLPHWFRPRDFASDASPISSITNSYDESGQARRDAGTGQGTPLDETGCFVFSRVGVPVGPSPPPTSPLVITDVLLPPTRTTTPHYEIATSNSDSPPTLKRKRSDDLPKTPCHTFGGLTNTDRTGSMPIQPARPIKRPRLQSPFLFGSDLPCLSCRENSSNFVMKKLQQDVRKQTELLAAILSVLQNRDHQDDV
ncbi:hypothetical protein JVT61DRAFT_14292 [Boletus reticuloceps]|uniref:Uncharacterized protein n=1 Tax=Boletus reticuloceps TaxID=495285 RepID=A0A8I2YCT3_9AGAM|nr:hypothetical protein JVT61DRAFT_14292 [Boletus reticuloceps]